MKIVIPGGSGQMGDLLARHFHDNNHEVVVLTRHPAQTDWKTVRWDGQTMGPWIQELDGADVIINLTGRSVNCRYTPKNKCDIWSSRVRSIRVLERAILERGASPSVWLQASTATLYDHQFNTPNDEYTGVLGGEEPNAPSKWRFSIDVARAWEGEFALVALPHTRKVVMRTSLVFNPDPGSVFTYLLKLVQLGLGGRVGAGDQFVSWIHELDVIRAIEHLIHRSDLSGAFIFGTPFPVTNSDFMKELRDAWGFKWGIPTPEWLLKIGAVLIQTESELILKSRKVHPTRLIESGFEFSYPKWTQAAQNLCDQWRNHTH